MPRCIEDPVRSAIARQLAKDPKTIRPSHHLQEDLGMDAIDLVLVALNLEEGTGNEFPVARLAHVHTVAELAHVARAWAEEGPITRRSA